MDSIGLDIHLDWSQIQAKYRSRANQANPKRDVVVSHRFRASLRPVAIQRDAFEGQNLQLLVDHSNGKDRSQHLHTTVSVQH